MNIMEQIYEIRSHIEIPAKSTQLISICSTVNHGRRSQGAQRDMPPTFELSDDALCAVL